MVSSFPDYVTISSINTSFLQTFQATFNISMLCCRLLEFCYLENCSVCHSVFILTEFICNFKNQYAARSLSAVNYVHFQGLWSSLHVFDIRNKVSLGGGYKNRHYETAPFRTVHKLSISINDALFSRKLYRAVTLHIWNEMSLQVLSEAVT